jgi:hypothetical protein
MDKLVQLSLKACLSVGARRGIVEAHDRRSQAQYPGARLGIIWRIDSSHARPTQGIYLGTVAQRVLRVRIMMGVAAELGGRRSDCLQELEAGIA